MSAKSRIFMIVAALIIGIIVGLNTAQPSDGAITPRPAWLHVSPVHGYPDCGKPGHRQGVIVWSKAGPDGDGGASALVCKSGRAYTS